MSTRPHMLYYPFHQVKQKIKAAGEREISKILRSS